jgi:hypothetical protein
MVVLFIIAILVIGTIMAMQIHESRKRGRLSLNLDRKPADAKKHVDS